MTGVREAADTAMEAWIRFAGQQPCNCEVRCGDVEDDEGVCKGLLPPPRQPLVEIVVVPRV